VNHRIDPAMSGALMVCGTASDVGKSHMVTGLCRMLARRGVRVAPFKAQNMALNSFVTNAGDEIGRSTAVQAMAAGAEPEAAMNPVLLKPTDATRSQVVVMGRALDDDIDFITYRSYHSRLRTIALDALTDLRHRFDVVICEGAGGAAEINLIDGDIVNLPLAAAADIPAIVVGDIERGGVFAALFGTVALLPEGYRGLVRGFVINKFRGDASLLDAGTAELERRCGVPTLGVVPWVDGVGLDAEDSMALPLHMPSAPGRPGSGVLDVAVVRLPRISNFTDFDPLAVEDGVGVRMVASAAIGDPDLLIIPGTKSTVADMAWMRSRGLDRVVAEAARRPDGPVVLGICGGYQMLGRSIHDDVESRSGSHAGLGLLEVSTTFAASKVTLRRSGTALGSPVTGYEIHHGRMTRDGSQRGWVHLGDDSGDDEEGCTSAAGRVWGTSLHGLFEEDAFRSSFLAMVADRRGKQYTPSGRSFAAARGDQFDRLADALERWVDIAALERIIGSTTPLPAPR